MTTKKLVELKQLYSGRQKWKVVIYKKNGEKQCTIRFGARGYSDYTIHKNRVRKQHYLIRHRKREDWSYSGGLCSAGFWSRWLLWNKTSINKSARDIEKRFKSLRIIIV